MMGEVDSQRVVRYTHWGRIDDGDTEAQGKMGAIQAERTRLTVRLGA